ncbi:hypothetical protein J6A31_09110 [bacterium]|nr:hypothetical protein [bacterium]
MTFLVDNISNIKKEVDINMSIGDTPNCKSQDVCSEGKSSDSSVVSDVNPSSREVNTQQNCNPTKLHMSLVGQRDDTFGIFWEG